MEENKIKKMCNFYVSDVHLITMILPYLSKRIKDGDKFITIFEKDLAINLDIILDKINIKEEEKDVIKRIGWNNKKNYKVKSLEREVNKIIEDKETINFMVVGSEGYIDSSNEYIEKVLKNKFNNKITIINCYEVEQFNSNIINILDKHDKILNTSGEKEIEEVFAGYTKKMA